MPRIWVRSKALAVSFGALLATLGGGCSGADADADVGLVSQARFPQRFADVWCQSVAPCCAPAQVDHDPAACQAQAQALAASRIAERVTGATSYSPAAATLCLSRLERALNKCEIEEASSACSLIFVGPSPEGSACKNGSACASGYCALGEAGLSGVCAQATYQAPIHGQAGEPCVGSCGVPGSFECPSSLLPNSDRTTTYCYAEDGLYCRFDSDALEALSCQPYAAIGARCTDVSCVPGSFCAGGSCVAQQSSGPCLETPDQCEAHSYCDADSQCQPKKPIGAACDSGEECSDSSCGSETGTESSCNSGNSLLARACSGEL